MAAYSIPGKAYPRDLSGHEAEHSQMGLISPVNFKNYGPWNPITIPHQGNENVYPKNTEIAYNNIIADGGKVVDLDVQSLSDGELVIMHDTTVDSTTTSTGNVSSFDTAGWSALVNDTSDQMKANFGNTKCPFLSNVLKSFVNRSSFSIEAKNTSAMDAIIKACINAGVKGDSVILSSFATTGLNSAVANGFQAMYLSETAPNTNIASLKAAGVQWLGCNKTASGANVQEWIDQGFKIIYYTLSRRSDKIGLLSPSGYFVEDYIYFMNSKASRTTDNFVIQTWTPGTLANYIGNRGSFTAPNYWTITSSAAAYNGALHGYLCPIANPTAFSFNFTLKLNSANEATRWFGIALMEDDKPYVDTNSIFVSNGYHFIVRKDGRIQIYSVTSGQVAGVLLASVSGTVMADNDERIYTISVTPTTLTLTCNTTSEVVTVDNTLYRGAYINLGCVYSSWSVKDVSVV